MKLLKNRFVFILLFLPVCVLGWFAYTRFLLPIYWMEGNTLVYGGQTYIMEDKWLPSDDEYLGRTIGIAVGSQRTLTDLIWPYWVIEYKSDPGHLSLLVRGLMDSGGRYTKVP